MLGLFLSASAFAADAPKDQDAKATAKPAKAAKAGPEKATKGKDKPKAPGPNDPDLAKAGKVIEFDSSGNGKVVKGEDIEFREARPDERVGGPAAEDKTTVAAPVEEKPLVVEMTAAEACRERFKAKCAFLGRCLSGGSLPFSCDDLMSACDGATGPSPYPKKEVDACSKGVTNLKCSQMDTTNLAGLDPEMKVPACRAMVEAERVAPEETPATSTSSGHSSQDPGVDIGNIDIGAALSGH
jgi:hypothetical protein